MDIDLTAAEIQARTLDLKQRQLGIRFAKRETKWFLVLWKQVVLETPPNGLPVFCDHVLAINPCVFDDLWFHLSHATEGVKGRHHIQVT